MKKIFITLLTFGFSANLFTCYASNNFDYGVNGNEGFEDVITIDTNGSTGNSESEDIHRTTVDYVPLLEKTISVPVGKNVSALTKAFCKFYSSTYDASAALFNVYCGDNSKFTLTFSGDGYSLSGKSKEGELAVYDIPEGTFSSYIKNDGVTDLSCEAFLLGYGLDETPEEGFHLELKCDDEIPSDDNSSDGKANILYWLIPVIVGGAAVMGTIIGCLIYHVKNA